MAFTMETVAQIQGSVEELISRSRLLETRIVALENWELPTIPVYEDALEELDEDEELIPDLNLPPGGGTSPVTEVNQGLGFGAVNLGSGQAALNLGHPQPYPIHSNPFMTNTGSFSPVNPGSHHSDDNQATGALEDSLRWKDVSNVRMPALPDSAGSFRAWRRFDRVLCSWFTKDTCLKGHFGTRTQAFVEESIATNRTLRGRLLLNLVVRS